MGSALARERKANKLQNQTQKYLQFYQMSVLARLQSIRYRPANQQSSSLLISIEQVSANKKEKLSNNPSQANKFQEIDPSHPRYHDWRDSIVYYEVSQDESAKNGRMISGNVKAMRQENENGIAYRQLPMYLQSSTLNISIYKKQKNTSCENFIHAIGNQKAHKKFSISRKQITAFMMVEINNSNSSTQSQSCKPIDPSDYEYKTKPDQLSKDTWHCQIFPKLSSGQELQLNFIFSYDCCNGYLRAGYGNTMGIGHQEEVNKNQGDSPQNKVFISHYKTKVISSSNTKDLQHILNYSKPQPPPKKQNKQAGFFGFFGFFCCGQSQVSDGSHQIEIENDERKPDESDLPEQKRKSSQDTITKIDSGKFTGQSY